MRIVSLITAVAVVSILYVLVFERDVLRGFSDGCTQEGPQFLLFCSSPKIRGARIEGPIEGPVGPPLKMVKFVVLLKEFIDFGGLEASLFEVE